MNDVEALLWALGMSGDKNARLLVAGALDAARQQGFREGVEAALTAIGGIGPLDQRWSLRKAYEAVRALIPSPPPAADPRQHPDYQRAHAVLTDRGMAPPDAGYAKGDKEGR